MLVVKGHSQPLKQYHFKNLLGEVDLLEKGFSDCSTRTPRECQSDVELRGQDYIMAEI